MSLVIGLIGQSYHYVNQRRFPFSQNFPFEILKIFRVKWKDFFHAGEKLAMPLADPDGARIWCEREQICEQ